jgi:hypothetical protein
MVNVVVDADSPDSELGGGSSLLVFILPVVQNHSAGS